MSPNVTQSELHGNYCEVLLTKKKKVEPEYHPASKANFHYRNIWVGVQRNKVNDNTRQKTDKSKMWDFP